MKNSKIKFQLGQVVATPGALEALGQSGETALPYLARHQSGDWGTLSAADIAENELSVNERLRILSAYILKNGTKIWIITEADRSSTTVLLPEEY